MIPAGHERIRPIIFDVDEMVEGFTDLIMRVHELVAVNGACFGSGAEREGERGRVSGSL